MSGNPFSAPQSGGQQVPPPGYPGPGYPSGAGLSHLKPPAIILIVVSVLSILNVALGPIVKIYVGQLTVDFSDAVFVGNICGAAVLSLIQLIILVSAVYMLQGVNRKTCRTGAVLACIPLCSPCLFIGIPFGIWALVLLSKPEVQRAFKS